MARSRSRGGSSRSRGQRSQSRKAPTTRAAAQPVEVVEEEKGLGIDDGIVIMSTVLLVVAWLLIDYDKGRYGAGLFF